MSSFVPVYCIICYPVVGRAPEPTPKLSPPACDP
jgi:hypothetical protein